MPLWLGKRAQSYSWADCDLCSHVHVCHLSGLGRRLEQRTREGRRRALHRCEGQHSGNYLSGGLFGREGLGGLWLGPTPSYCIASLL